MTSSVWLTLNARPCCLKVSRRKTAIDLGLRGSHTDGIVNTAVNAVVCYLISWPQGVGVVGKWTVCDASRRPQAVATKAVGRVEEHRAAESSGVDLLLPVSGSR